MQIPEIAIEEIIDRYSLILLDAYGVLVEHNGAIPGADSLIKKLRMNDKDFFLLTNDASRTPTSLSLKYKKMGLEIEENRILSSGTIIKDYFDSHNLKGLRCMVIGTEESLQMVEDAGGILQSTKTIADTDIVILCDDETEGILDSLHVIFNSIIKSTKDSNEPILLLANPDVIYPCSRDEVGIAIGSIAKMLEAALRLKLPDRKQFFQPLGKPETGLFKKALSLSDFDNVIMIGDQLTTDILGAQRAGIDSALATYSSATSFNFNESKIIPTYLLSKL